MARIVFLFLALTYSCSGFAQVDCLLRVAKSLIGVQEGPINNRGPMVDSIIRYAGGIPGQAWCSYTMIYIWKKCNQSVAGRNGMALSWAKNNKKVPITSSVRATDIFVTYSKQLKRIGHVGMVYETYPEEPFFKSFEGNTNARGQRESKRSVAACLIRQYDNCYGFYRWTNP